MVSVKQEDLTNIRKTSVVADKQNRTNVPFSEQAGIQLRLYRTLDFDTMFFALKMHFSKVFANIVTMNQFTFF